MYKALYFLFATGWGYYVLKDQYYLPWYLGGSGDENRGFEEHPYPVHCHGLKEYSLITMGYHVGGLITHFFSTRKNDFIEMGLHHIVALYLFGGFYLFNVWELGASIAFLHDIADITTNIVKALSESRDKIFVGIFFVLHMCIWFFTRNLCLPYLIYKIYTLDPPIPNDINFPVMPFFCWLLFCMFALHCYWFSMFVVLLRKYIKVGATED
jgi:hypothetical protein